MAGTTAFDAFLSWNVVDVIVLAFIGSLNVAVGAVPALTPFEPAAGVVPVTVGGIDSGWIADAMFIWTSVGLRARS